MQFNNVFVAADLRLIYYYIIPRISRYAAEKNKRITHHFPASLFPDFVERQATSSLPYSLKRLKAFVSC